MRYGSKPVERGNADSPKNKGVVTKENRWLCKLVGSLVALISPPDALVTKLIDDSSNHYSLCS